MKPQTFTPIRGSRFPRIQGRLILGSFQDLRQADNLRFLVLVLGLAAFLVSVLNCAWVCDDAYITFRTVGNFLNGHGLRWNVSERVQSYTHPFWMFLHIPFNGLFDHIYYVTIILSVLASTLAVAVLCTRVAKDAFGILVVVLLCTSSKAFIDFSTSGLENPLSFLLIALFYARLLRSERAERALPLLAGLAAFNRLDTLLLTLPGIIYRYRHERWAITLRDLAVGMSPILAWILFSIVYYGFPFPNTAYAKLNTGISGDALLAQGLSYLRNSLRWDPITLLACSVSVPLAVWKRDSTKILIAVGGSIYVIYVVNVGGDFMSGRSLTLPFLSSVAVIASERMPSKVVRIAFCIGIFASAFVLERSPWRSGENYGGSEIEAFGENNITNERAFYYNKTGLRTVLAHNGIPQITWGREGEKVRDLGGALIGRLTVGYFGYYGGPSLHVIDEMALSDVFLARLPVYDSED